LGRTWEKAVVVTFRIICRYLSADKWLGRMRVSTELGRTWEKAVVVTFRIICRYLSGDSEDNHRQPVRTIVVFIEK